VAAGLGAGAASPAGLVVDFVLEAAGFAAALAIGAGVGSAAIAGGCVGVGVALVSVTGTGTGVGVGSVAGGIAALAWRRW